MRFTRFWATWLLGIILSLGMVAAPFVVQRAPAATPFSLVAPGMPGVVGQSGEPSSAFIKALFANGEDGCWYDLSDRSTLFQDAAGSTPVVTTGDPIRRVNDKSGKAKNWLTLSSDAQRPTWNQGLGALDTDGTATWLFSQMTWTPGWTIIAAVQSISTGSSGSPTLIGRGSFNRVSDDASTGLMKWSGNSTNTTVTIDPAFNPRTNPFIFSTVRVDDTIQLIRVNGAQLSAFIPNTNQQVYLTVGAQDGFGSTKGATRAWQFLAINRAMTSSEVAQFETFAAQKARISAAPQNSVYSVFVVAGQSNTYFGTALDPALDTALPGRIKEYTQAGAVVDANDPLDHFVGRTPGYIGFAMPFLRAYAAAHPSETLIVLPSGYGGTGFSSPSPNTWANSAGSLRERTFARANAVMKMFPGSSYKGTLWHNGETDGGDHTAALAYASNLDAFIAELRSTVTGASASPFVTGGLLSQWVGANADRLAVQAALSGVASRNSKAGFADASSPTILTGSDGLHFTAGSQRTFGDPRYYDAYIAALSDP